MNLIETLKLRDTKYDDWTAGELKYDACMDLLKLLNVYSDICCPTNSEIQIIHMLASAINNIHNLEIDDVKDEQYKKSVEHHELPEWCDKYAKIWEKKCALDEAFNDLMNDKCDNKEVIENIKLVFKTHKDLATAIMALNDFSDAEKETIISSVKSLLN